MKMAHRHTGWLEQSSRRLAASIKMVPKGRPLKKRLRQKT